MASFTENKRFWLEFIKAYRELPALWKVKSDSYKNRNLKTEGYNVLVEKLKSILPEANREVVKKKINALRTNYRRELKKIKDSSRPGTGTDEIYVPTLWYFNDIDFLRDQVTVVAGTCTLNYDNSEDEDSDNNETTSPQEDTPSRKRRVIPDDTPQRKIVRKTEVVQDERNELLSLARDRLRSSNDDADILGKAWALDYKQLKPDQQLFAKKAINDILFEGRLGTLHRYSVVINDPQTSRSSSTVSHISSRHNQHSSST
ncbi:uncharacterized protein LOC143216377 [Lasioglossum baleicum]|uniref:uncharacterized protein LOC143216377 n=1 Tax=Lasioglossum baleicum TaxID=434251 RepID=UPI003FCCD9B3